MGLKMVTILERSKESLVQFSASTLDMSKALSQLTYSFICFQYENEPKMKIPWDSLGRVNIK